MSTGIELDRGQVALLVEAERLGAVSGGVAYRMALERVEGGPAVVLRLELTTGPAEDDPREWDYGGVVFASGWLTGQVAQAWLTDGAGEVHIGRSPVRFSIGAVSNSAAWERLPSRSGRDVPPLAWPYRRVAFPCLQGLGPSSRPRFLVGPRIPSFPSFEHAAEDFFHGRPLVGVPPHLANLVVIREQDEDVRIDSVKFSAASVEIALSSPRRSRAGDRRSLQVEFSPSGGDRLRYASFDYGKDTAVESFPLLGGVPDEWWLVVSEDHCWMDYRQFSRYGPWPSDVELLRGALDPGDEVAMMVQGGEGPAMEFKRQLPTDAEGARKIARTVAAFANGLGGRLLFGIEDDGTVVGIRESFPAAGDRLTDLVSGNLATRPVVHLERYETERGRVIALVVDQGAHRPYGVDASNPRYYVRCGGTTRPARPEEVSTLAQISAAPRLGSPSGPLF